MAGIYFFIFLIGKAVVSKVSPLNMGFGVARGYDASEALILRLIPFIILLSGVIGSLALNIILTPALLNLEPDGLL